MKVEDYPKQPWAEMGNGLTVYYSNFSGQRQVPALLNRSLGIRGPIKRIMLLLVLFRIFWFLFRDFGLFFRFRRGRNLDLFLGNFNQGIFVITYSKGCFGEDSNFFFSIISILEQV